MDLQNVSKLLNIFIRLSLISTLSACGLSDLRPDQLPEVTDSQRSNGKKLLADVADTHGSRLAWQSKSTVTVKIRDNWFKPEAWVAMPWAKNDQRMNHTLIPLSDNARIDFLDGPDEGRSWGIQHWRTYAINDGAVAFASDASPEFWIPTMSYFIEAPFRMMEATTVYELPEKTIGNARFHRVFFTWGDDSPQVQTDQYIAWIDAKTKRLRYLQYTVRDLFGFITGCMSYEDYEKVGNFLLAKTMHVVDKPGGDRALHGFFVDGYNFDVHPTHYVIIDENQHGTKHD